MSGGRAAAIAAWREALGAEHVVEGPPLRATFAADREVTALLSPGSVGEVQECLRIANRCGTPLHPVSAGRNWGYGSQLPPRTRCAVLHLGRLDKILDFNPEMAWVTVEPGVTFRQLHAFLVEKNATLFATTTGASPEASLIGNALERGDGRGPCGDRFAHLCNLQVVLPSGELIHTGFGRWPDALAANAGRWGLGPDLDGLFAQSGLGVVTRATIWLTPLPRCLHQGIWRIERDEQLPAVVDALRGLRLRGALRSTVALWNDYKTLTLLRQFPWELTGGETPLSREWMATLREGAWYGRWSGALAIYGASRAQADADRALVEEALQPVVNQIDFAPPLEPTAMATAVGPLLGVPDAQNVTSVYWRKRTPPPSPLDPDRDGCGVMWCSVAVPLEGRAAKDAALRMEVTALAHGFEPLIAMIAPTERLLYLVASLVWDRDVPGDDQRAQACHDALLAEAIAHGAYPFRLGIHSMGAAPPDPAYARLLATLKDALDPGHILSPGRYEWLPAGSPERRPDAEVISASHE